ncbi:hypothetical protein DFH06DRAFT_1314063 [Mycena polygramma]|nr:hypothetical protein DFH06DRAFT_1314063 [Mycena polygramma]
MQHSDRWQNIDLTVPSRGLNMLQRAKGRVSMLERLSLCILSGESMPAWNDNTGIFFDAPRLKHVHFSSSYLSNLPKLPWKQLHTFGCPTPQRAEDLISVLALMIKLSHPDAAFELHDLNGGYLRCPLHLPAITSTIRSLTFLVHAHKRYGQRAAQILAEIVGCLTLTHPRELHVRTLYHWDVPLAWPVHQLDPLSSRSAFHHTLRVLEIPGVAITEDDLVRSLASLGSLEHQIIADQGDSDYRIPEHILITNSFLLRLACPPDTADRNLGLVPQLKYMGCTSLCRFNAQVLFEFMASRTALGRDPFETVISCFKGVSVEFEPEVSKKISELVIKGTLRFQVKEFEDE